MDSAVWFTPAEAASYARVNVVTLRRAVRAGQLRAFRVNAGRNLRFRRSDLDAWLASSPVEVRS
ncbi:MAG TPA: helix-turn-helix domain-containing protein [Vicinamibacterales bacterium]